jgi:hypothetical protein
MALDYVVSYIIRQIDNGRPVMVHCSGGKGRTGTIYLIKEGNVLSAEQAINRLRKIRGESIQTKDQESSYLNSPLLVVISLCCYCSIAPNDYYLPIKEVVKNVCKLRLPTQ